MSLLGVLAVSVFGGLKVAGASTPEGSTPALVTQTFSVHHYVSHGVDVDPPGVSAGDYYMVLVDLKTEDDPRAGSFTPTVSNSM
jgi:hypothetical protein